MNERPLCDICDQPVRDDHYYSINGDVICMHCMEEYFREDIFDENQD